MLNDAKCAQRHTVQVFARRPFNCPLLVFPALFDHFAFVSLQFHLFGTVVLEASLIFGPVCLNVSHYH